MKKLKFLFLALLMLFGAARPAFADDPEPVRPTVSGSSIKFMLETECTVSEAAGKTKISVKGSSTLTFSYKDTAASKMDLSGCEVWAYANKVTQGGVMASPRTSGAKAGEQVGVVPNKKGWFKFDEETKKVTIDFCESGNYYVAFRIVKANSPVYSDNPFWDFKSDSIVVESYFTQIDSVVPAWNLKFLKPAVEPTNPLVLYFNQTPALQFSAEESGLSDSLKSSHGDYTYLLEFRLDTYETEEYSQSLHATYYTQDTLFRFPTLPYGDYILGDLMNVISQGQHSGSAESGVYLVKTLGEGKDTIRIAKYNGNILIKCLKDSLYISPVGEAGFVADSSANLQFTVNSKEDQLDKYVFHFKLKKGEDEVLDSMVSVQTEGLVGTSSNYTTRTFTCPKLAGGNYTLTVQPIFNNGLDSVNAGEAMTCNFKVANLKNPESFNVSAEDIFVTFTWQDDVDTTFQVRLYDTVKKETTIFKVTKNDDGLTYNDGNYTYNKTYVDSAVYKPYIRAIILKDEKVADSGDWVELQGLSFGRPPVTVAPIKATLAWGANALGADYVKGGQQNLASARTLYFQSNARVGTSAGNALVAVEVAYHDTTVYDTVKYAGYNGVEYRISNPYPRYGTTRVEAHLLKVGFDGKVYGVWGDDVVRDTFNVMGMVVSPKDTTLEAGQAEPKYNITLGGCTYGTDAGKYFVRVSYQCYHINGNYSYKLYDTIKTEAGLANYALIDWRNKMATAGTLSTEKDTTLYLSFELWPVGGENYFSSTNRQVNIYAPVPEFTIDTLSSFDNNMALDSARGVWISKSEDLGIATHVSFDNDDNRYFCKYELRDASYQKVTNTAGTLLDDGYCLVGLYGLNYTLMGIPNGENYHLRLSLYECIGRDENNDNILVQLSRVRSISLTFDVKAPVIVVTTTGVLDTVEGEFTSLQSGTYKVDYWHYAANSVPELSVDLENVGMNLATLLADDNEAKAMYGIYADGAENTIAYGYLSDTNTTVKLLTSDGDTLLDGNYNVSIMVSNGDYSIEIMKDLYIRIGAPALLSVSCGPEGEFTPAEDAFTTNNPEFTVNVENAGEGWYVVTSVTNMEGEEGEELYDTARADKLKLTFENLPNAIGEWSAAYVAVFELYNADGNMLKRVRKYFDIAGPDVPVMAVTPALAEGRYEALGTTGYLFKDSLPVFSAVVAGVKYYDEYKVEGQLYIKDTFNTGSTNYLKLVKVDADEDVEINYDTLLADGDYVAQTTLLHLNSKTDTYVEAAFDTIFFTVKYEAPVVKPTLTVEPESGYTTAEGVDWVFATANPRISFEAEGINEYWVKAFVYNTDSMSGDVPMLVDSALVITDGVYVFGGEDGYILGNYKATFMLCDTNDKEVGDLVVKNFRIAENPEMTVIPMGRVYADTGKAYIFKTNSPKFDATVAGIIYAENYRVVGQIRLADSTSPFKTVFATIERETAIVDFDTTLADGKYEAYITLEKAVGKVAGDFEEIEGLAKSINFTVKYVAPSTAELEIEPVSAYLVGEDVDWIFATANPTLSFTVDTLKDWAVIAHVYNLDSAAGDVAPLVETATISNEGKYTFGGDGYTLGNYEATFMLVDPNNNDEALWDAAIVRKFRIGENPEMVVAPAESSRAIGDTGNSYIFRNNKAEFDIDVAGVIEFGKYRIEAQLYNRKAFDTGSTNYIEMVRTDSLTPSMLVAFDSVLADGQYVAHIAIQKINKRGEYDEVYGAHKDMFFTVAYKEAVEATLTVTPKSEFTAGTDVDWVFATTKPELKFEVEGLEKWSVIAAIYNAAETTEVSVPVSCDTINAASFVFGGANGFAVGNYDAKFMLVDENGEDVLDAYIVKSFTISQSVAREEAELLGVNVYPNPTSGLFNVSVPVRADVTIFNASGRVVAGETRVEGLRSYTLNASGVYFVRVAAEGKTTVKRVIVR